MKLHFLLILMGTFSMVLNPSFSLAEEFYQYQDENGIYHFTDDKANIPQNRDIKVNAFEGSKTSGQANEITKQKASNETVSEAKVSKQSKKNKTGLRVIDKTEITAAQLNKEKQRLDEKLSDLYKNKVELSEVPRKNMTPGQLNTHKEKVKTLNAKIEEHQAQWKAFRKKVKAYNERVKSKKASNR